MNSFYENLGKTVSNLLSFEFALRNFLFVHNSQADSSSPIASDLYSLKVQDETMVTAFTNYDSLGKLIKDANEILKSKKLVTIDKKIVEVRDCIAHGRLASLGNSSTKIILKFAEPPKKSSKVKLTHRLELTDEWFEQFNKKILAYTTLLVELTITRTSALVKL